MVSLDVGYLKIGPGELFTLFFLSIDSKKACDNTKRFSISSSWFFAIILGGLIRNAALIGVNIMITIPARILMVGVICSDLAKIDTVERPYL